MTKHIQVAREYGDVYTCGYGPTPSGVEGHFEVPPTARYLTRSLVNLTAIQLGLHEHAARRTQFFRATKHLLERQNFDMVIANDVHSLQTAADLFNPRTVWVDMHEYAPLESEHDWRWKLAYQRHIRFLCSRHLSSVGAVSSVSKAICDRYAEDLCRKVYLIRNSADHRMSSPTPMTASTEVIRCVHVGAAIRARRLETLIEAIGEFSPHFSLDLFLVPTDSKYLRELERRVALFKNVNLRKPVKSEDVIETISSYDLGFVSIPPTSFNYANCLPNKFFQYVQARLPIVSGPIPEVAGTIREMKIGWVTSGFTKEDTRECLSTITTQSLEAARAHLESAALELSSARDCAIRRSVIEELMMHQ